MAAITGGLLYIMMWLAAMPLENNPVIDDHVIGAAVLAGLFLANAGRYYGLGKAWQSLDFVKGRRYLY